MINEFLELNSCQRKAFAIELMIGVGAIVAIWGAFIVVGA